MNKGSFSAHKTALYALFILGEAGIIIPYENGNDKNFLGFLLAVLIGLPIIYLLCFLARKIENPSKSEFKKYFIAMIYFLVAVFSLSLGVDCFNSFLGFAADYILPNASPYLIGLIFSSVIAVVCFSKREAFYKLGLISAVASAFMLFILFLFSVPQFDNDKIMLLSFPKIKDVLVQAFSYLKQTLSPVIILPFFQDFFLKENNKKSILKGYIIGSMFLAVCLLNSLLIFGNELSAKLDFPYSEAISTVTAGNIFMRLDGFSYYVFFMSCLIKIGLSVKLAAELFKRIINLFTSKKLPTH